MPINLKKALWLQLSVFTLFASCEQFSSQLLPQHFRDLHYDVNQCIKNSSRLILVSSALEDPDMVKMFYRYVDGKNVTIITENITSSIKEMALLQGITIYLTDATKKTIKESFIICEKGLIKVTLPLTKVALKTLSGYYVYLPENEWHDSYLKKASLLVEQSQPYLN